MSALATRSLALWGMDNATIRLIAERENQVFRVDHNNTSYALRLHRQGYRTDAELRSELHWMVACSDGGLHVPTPIAACSGEYLQVIEGVQVDMLEWLSGHPIGKTGQPLQSTDRVGLFESIGREMAKLHMVSDQWTPPNGFARCAWDSDGLLGETPLWGRFWDNPTLSADDRTLFRDLRNIAREHLTTLMPTLDYGLIHADLVRENMIMDGTQLHLIDFDDGGYGFRMFDIATALIKNLDEPDYPDLRDAMINGYHSLRALDTQALDLFLLLRATTYVGWVVPRLDEPDANLRNTRFVATARDLASSYLRR